MAAFDREANENRVRMQFFKELSKALTWIEQYVKLRTDDHLAWYAEKGGHAADNKVTVDRLEEAKKQLDRIRVHTLGGK
jgi:hypothetical protein